MPLEEYQRMKDEYERLLMKYAAARSAVNELKKDADRRHRQQIEELTRRNSELEGDVIDLKEDIQNMEAYIQRITARDTNANYSAANSIRHQSFKEMLEFLRNSLNA